MSSLDRMWSLIRQLQGALGGKAIRAGAVTAAGGIAAGDGFSVTKNGTGDYTITFDEPFASVPVVTPSAGRTVAFYTVKLHASTAVSESVFRVAVFVTNTTSAVDGDWQFTAVG